MAIHGVHILSAGREPVIADVVFVHGLRGDAYDTWTVDKICWPRDFLKTEPKLKHTRITTWGYDSSVAQLSDFSSQNSIFGHAENLLEDLARNRQEDHQESRPLVFVGHSLGGLVIKEALIRSAQYLHNDQAPDLGALYKYTAGAVFMGTPHRGSDQAGLAKIVSNVAQLSLRQPNDKLLDNLKKESDVLENQRKGFISISKKLPVVCLSEEKPVTGFGKIVDETSAVYDGFYVRSNSIPANHMAMCKYSSRNDIGYMRTSGVIIRLVLRAEKENIKLSRGQQAIGAPDQGPTAQGPPKDHNGRTKLHQAAMNGSRIELRCLLDQSHLESNMEDNYGMTSLHLAAEAGMANVILPLLKRNANIEAEDDRGRTPLACAAAEGCSNVVMILLGKGANLEAKDNEGRTPVYRAFTGCPSKLGKAENNPSGLSFANFAASHIKHGSPIAQEHEELSTIQRFEATLRAFVNKGADLNVHFGRDAIAYAAETQQLAACEYLIFKELESILETWSYEMNNSSNQFSTWMDAIPRLLKYRIKEFGNYDTGGGSVMHWAAKTGNIQVLRMMMDIGADVNAKTKKDVTPLHEAARFGHAPIALSLIAAGADINHTGSRFDRTPLAFAILSRNDEVAKVLVEKGADLKFERRDTNSNEEGPLYLAAKFSSETLVRLLIAKGCPVDERPARQHETALIMALHHGNASMVRLLVHEGADVRATNTNPQTVLHIAAAYSSLDPATCRLLLERGAKHDLCTKDYEGRTPVDTAAVHKNTRIEQILIDAGGKKASALD